MPDELGSGIRGYFEDFEEEPDHVFRLSAKYPVVTLTCFLLLTTAVWYTNADMGRNVFYLGLFITALLVERRRVCRAELGNFGLRCYDLLGRRYLDLDRVTISEVDTAESVEGKDFYIVARGARHRIPTTYESYLDMIAILEDWVLENKGPLLRGPDPIR